MEYTVLWSMCITEEHENNSFVSSKISETLELMRNGRGLMQKGDAFFKLLLLMTTLFCDDSTQQYACDDEYFCSMNTYCFCYGGQNRTMFYTVRNVKLFSFDHQLFILFM